MPYKCPLTFSAPWDFYKIKMPKLFYFSNVSYANLLYILNTSVNVLFATLKTLSPYFACHFWPRFGPFSTMIGHHFTSVNIWKNCINVYKNSVMLSYSKRISTCKVLNNLEFSFLVITNDGYNKYIVLVPTFLLQKSEQFLYTHTFPQSPRPPDQELVKCILYVCLYNQSYTELRLDPMVSRTTQGYNLTI